MPSSLGAHLRWCREARSRTLADLARETRLPESVLRGLETGELDALPGGSYARLYARTYARALGVDAEALLGDHATEPDDASPEPSVRAGRSQPRSERRFFVPLIVALLLVVTVAVAAALWADNRSSTPSDGIAHISDGSSAEHCGYPLRS